jgi:hypothetical protein
MLFEQVVITIQAMRGELSHFNNTSLIENILFGLMGIFITWLTIHTAIMLYKFSKQTMFTIPPTYVKSIQWELFIFILFSFQGGCMGYLYAHTVGGKDDGQGIAFLNWSITHGDLRIAHFFGLHALQILPLSAFLLQRIFS